jgi:hypothetical protein
MRHFPLQQRWPEAAWRRHEAGNGGGVRPVMVAAPALFTAGGGRKRPGGPKRPSGPAGPKTRREILFELKIGLLNL